MDDRLLCQEYQMSCDNNYNPFELRLDLCGVGWLSNLEVMRSVMNNECYKCLGYDLIDALLQVFPGASLKKTLNKRCYLSFFIEDIGVIHFQRWGKDDESFFIKLHLADNQDSSKAGLLHLNLKNIDIGEDWYTWKLDNPRRTLSKMVVSEYQKNRDVFQSGDTWNKLCETFIGLVSDILVAHSKQEIVSERNISNLYFSIEETRHVKVVESVMQMQFREKLLERYDGKCAICGHGPEIVLKEARMVPDTCDEYAVKNGILLRNDICELFNDGAIRIHPYSLLVEVHPSLKGTPYMKLAGRKLRKASVGESYPHFDHLDEKYADALEEYMYWEDDNEMLSG